MAGFRWFQVVSWWFQLVSAGFNKYDQWGDFEQKEIL